MRPTLLVPGPYFEHQGFRLQGASAGNLRAPDSQYQSRPPPSAHTRRHSFTTIRFRFCYGPGRQRMRSFSRSSAVDREARLEGGGSGGQAGGQAAGGEGTHQRTWGFIPHPCRKYLGRKMITKDEKLLGK